MKIDMRGISTLRITKMKDEYFWNWYAKQNCTKFILTHGTGNSFNDNDEFIIDDDTILEITGQVTFLDEETLFLILNKNEAIKIKIIRNKNLK